ncbi:MAG: hypothetical protein IJ412_10325 [Oscillospiraceae bacterium]|nr:hypothetical protein [Oscillospiraceae bacterium]
MKKCNVCKTVKTVLVVVATLAALAAAVLVVYKLLAKKKAPKNSVEVGLNEEGCADCCFDDCATCPIVEEPEYAGAPVEE